jgi:hypothetical protein
VFLHFLMDQVFQKRQCFQDCRSVLLYQIQVFLRFQEFLVVLWVQLVQCFQVFLRVLWDQ